MFSEQAVQPLHQAGQDLGHRQRDGSGWNRQAGGFADRANELATRDQAIVGNVEEFTDDVVVLDGQKDRLDQVADERVVEQLPARAQKLEAAAFQARQQFRQDRAVARAVNKSGPQDHRRQVAVANVFANEDLRFNLRERVAVDAGGADRFELVGAVMIASGIHAQRTDMHEPLERVFVFRGLKQ